jgi:hypothetical protein
MTEEEWLTCDDPGKMLAFLKGKVSERKLRLFACACCREKVARKLSFDSEASAIIDAVEVFAETSVEPQELMDYRRRAYWIAAEDPFTVAQHASKVWTDSHDGSNPDPGFVCRVFREIAGNPFRPVTIDSRWLSPTVKNLAETIYDQRAFDRMPILGDALEDAGCSNADILDHCRSGQEHVRGCWVVDLVLGKE